MAYEDKVDPQRITLGLRGRVEEISYDAKDVTVLLDLASDQVRDIKVQLLNGITKFSSGDFQATFSLIDVAKRELERIITVSEEFRNCSYDARHNVEVTDGR